METKSHPRLMESSVDMKVWLDCDSGMYETVSAKPPSSGKAVEGEMTEAEYREYQQVLTSYTAWQDRLECMRKNGRSRDE